MNLKGIYVRFILICGKENCGIKNKDRRTFQSHTGVWSDTPLIRVRLCKHAH